MSNILYHGKKECAMHFTTLYMNLTLFQQKRATRLRSRMFAK